MHGPRLLKMLVCSLTMYCVVQIAETRARDWNVPCTLTESQITMLSRLDTREQASRAPGIAACRFYDGNIVLVRFTDGRMGAFGIGELTITDAPSPINPQTDPPLFTGTEEEHQLFIELDRIWLEAGLGDQLSAEDLARSDRLVRELFDRTPSAQVQLADYEFLGMRGNRYRDVVEGLSEFPPAAAIVFYMAYLDSSLPHARQEDLPSDQQKLTAIAALLHAFEFEDLRTKFHLGYEVSLDIKRIDPDAYRKLQALGVVTETNP